MFLVIAVLNAVVAGYIFLLVPEYLLRFVAFVAARLVYRFHVRGDEHIPAEGAAILVCNHVSFVDAVLLMAASPRPIRFIMDHRDLPHAGAGRVLPARARRSRSRRRRSTPPSTSRRSRGRARCSTTATCSASFPRARITADGELGEFKGGVMKMLETNPVPVVPLALHEPLGLVLLARRAARR